jgi:ribose transport system ATP-binding protein
VSSPGLALGVRGVAKSYRGTHALRGVSVDVSPGSVHALLGGNGSGKSTLVKVLAGVTPADEGDIEVGSVTVDARSHTPSQAAELGLHFVHQQDSTFGQLTVAENLAIGRGFETGRGGRVRWRAQRRRAKELLERFEIKARPDDELAALRGATRTLVAIARALQDQEQANDDVLVLDEPTASLPHREVDLLLSALTRYAAAGQTILYVSHRIPEVVSIATHATVLRDGLVAAGLVGDEISHDRLVSLIVNAPQGESEEQVATASRPAGSSRPREGVIVKTEGVREGGRVLSVSTGELVGLAGLLGAGRSALLRALFGLTADGGGHRYRLYDSTVTMSSPGQAMKSGIALVPENRVEDGAFMEMTVRENLTLASLDSLHPLQVLRAPNERREARKLMGSLRVLAASVDAPFPSLSGGNQQKVILTRWLARKPRLLLLDEPTQGVDVGARQEIHRIIREAAARGTAVLISSSEFEELAALCDRIAIVSRGRIVDEIEDEDLSDEDVLAAVHEWDGATL